MEEHTHEHEHKHEHAHRTLGDVKTILENAAMTEGARALAVKIFEILAEAEAAAAREARLQEPDIVLLKEIRDLLQKK